MSSAYNEGIELGNATEKPDFGGLKLQDSYQDN